MDADSYSQCLTKIDQFLQENNQLPRCWRTRFVETHLRLFKIFVCYTGKWSDEDKATNLGSLPADYHELEANLIGNSYCDYVARFVFPEKTVDFEEGPALRFEDSYVPLDFQENIATTCKELLSTQPPISDVLVFSQFADSVKDYIVSLWLELQEYVRSGKLTDSSHISSKVEEIYMGIAQWLGYFRNLIFTLVDHSIDQLKKLLARAGVVMLNLAIVACDSQILDRDDLNFAAQMESKSRDLFSTISEARALDFYYDVLRSYADIVEVKKLSSSSMTSRAPFISMKTFEDLVESYAKLYKLVENEVHTLLPVVDSWRQNSVVENSFPYKVKSLLEFMVKQARSLTRSTPNIALSKLCHKLNLIKAEILVLELHNQKANLEISADNEVATISKASKFLTTFFKTLKVDMKENDKYILSLIETLLREEQGGSLCSSPDQSEKMTQEEDMISKSSLTIFKLFKAEAMLLVLIENKASLKFLDIYSLEILQKSLIFLRAIIQKEDMKLFKISEGVIDLVFSFGCGDDKIKNSDVLPKSFSRMVEHNFAEIGALYRGCPWLLHPNFPRTAGPVFIDFLLRNMRDSLGHNPSTSSNITFLKASAQKLLQELDSLQQFAKDVMQNNICKECIVCLTFEAEYIITNLFQAGGVPVRYTQLVLLIAFAEAKDLKAKIQECDRHHKEERHHGTITNVVPQTLKESSNSGTKEIIVGFEGRAKIIEDQLITGSKERKIISIVGMGGVGKTTLAKKVYDCLSIQTHFEHRAWCTVSQVYQKKELLLQILGCIVKNIEEIKGKDDDDLANTLRRSLLGTRYLVVMDDMWSIKAWNDFKKSLPDNHKGSRILFTTRNSEVVSKGNLYHLPLLTAEESLDLFQKKLFHGDSCPEELLEVGRLIVRNCKGLPLAIVVIAGLLGKMEKKENMKDQWEKFSLQLMSQTAHENDAEKQIIHILEFSYNHLSSHLKPCFLYLGMFLEDQQIPAQKLKLLWIAEGFVQKIGPESLEETAEEYLKELISLNLVMEGQRRSRGGAKSCQMHDTVRFLCLNKAKEENIMQLVKLTDGGHSGKSSSCLISSSYRICFQPNMDKDRISDKIIDPHVHSLLIFPSKVNQELYFFSGDPKSRYLTSLRVLDMGYIYVGRMDLKDFEMMRCLTYLALWGHFNSVPSSIVQLFNLETLILKGWLDKINVSTELWSLRKLRHVRINAIGHSSLPDKEIESISNIVSLSMLNIRDPSPGENFLRRLIDIKILKCQFERDRDTYSKENYVFPAMDTLIRLESLHLSVAAYHSIQFPSNFKFPPNLKKLTLVSFELPLENISAIGENLTNLEVLKVLSCEIVRDDLTWEMTEGKFPNLKYLEIYDFGFKNWNAPSDSFPSLERLVLQRCPKLEEIPDSFGEIGLLQMIDIKDCSESAYASVERIYKQQVESGNKEFKVFITRR